MAETKSTAKQKKPRRLPQKESVEAAQAFADYVGMTGKRSIRQLVEQYRHQSDPKPPTVREKTLSDWSVAFHWQDRLRGAINAETKRKLEMAEELDADTFHKTSQRLNELVTSPGFIDPSNVTRIRESVRKAESKSTIDVTHSGTIKHAHHDMSQFTDEEIDTLAAIAERQKAEVSQ